MSLGFDKDLCIRVNDFFSGGQAYLYDYAEKYGSNSVCWIGPMTFFLTSDPQAIQDILQSKNCVDKPSKIYHNLSLITGAGILIHSGMTGSYLIC